MIRRRFKFMRFFSALLIMIPMKRMIDDDDGRLAQRASLKMRICDVLKECVVDGWGRTCFVYVFVATALLAKHRD